jgi:hypothetical protein
MIQDALGDTLAGIVRWDPAPCSLAQHLNTVVCSRLSHEFDPAEQFSHLNVADASEVDVNEALGGNAKPADTRSMSTSTSSRGGCGRANLQQLPPNWLWYPPRRRAVIGA